MPWPTGNVKCLREEFVRLALQPGTCIKDLCEQFQISRKTGYKWINRIKHSTSPCFSDRSKRPHRIHYQVSSELKEIIIVNRLLHRHWGARKLKAHLINQGIKVKLPSTSTINKILSEEELIHPQERHHAYKRFEYDRPNALWQMDFKGYFSLLNGTECHALTIIDDHSRYLVCLSACEDERLDTVKAVLINVFQRYGLPEKIALDHGSCWRPKNRYKWSELTVWLMRLGIQIIHGKPYYPQGRGKDERLHRTLKLELINNVSMENLVRCQDQFDLWRHTYNHDRPHEALNLKPPITLYEVSSRRFSKKLPTIKYWPDDIIRHVDENGHVCIEGRMIQLTRALRGQKVALRLASDEDKLNIFFCQQLIKSINKPKKPLKQGKHVTHVDD